MAIEFDKENMGNGKRLQQSYGMGGMAKFLIDKGIVKNEKQAFYALLGVCATCLILSGYIFYAYVIGFPVKAKPLTPEQQKARQEFQERIQKARQNSQNKITTTP